MTPERWQQVEELYHATRARPPAERAAFLDRECHGDRTLREEVQSLLTANDAGEEFLETPALQVAAHALAKGAPFLVSGRRLGIYTVVAPIGAGGMGEVWRARDSSLGRDVAIKILPSIYSSDPERLRRFEQEAYAAGQLNHPNVLTIYGIGSEAGAPYLVTELLEGETLQDRLRDGPLSQRKALEYAAEIARGLAAAHGKGIVHRDLKPANLFVTADGRVKILDFGLAKLASPGDELGAGVRSASGLILGTVGYMSPEQARGQAADHRTDIFALGAILYEMLSGARAFTGDSPIEVMNAIVKADPPPLAGVSPAVDRVVRHCLEKQPSERFESARDLAFHLDAALELLSGSGGVATVAAARRSRGRGRRFAAAAAGVASMGAVAALLWNWNARALDETGVNAGRQTRSTVRSEIPPPELTKFGAMALSPDARVLAFIGQRGARRRLWIRSLDRLAAQPLAGTDGAEYPFWSPDSRSLGFFAAGKLKRIDIAGGTPQTLTDAPAPRGGAWSENGVIVFGSNPWSLRRIPSTGGVAEPVTVLDASAQEISHRWPQFLPGGTHFLYLAQSSHAEHRGIFVGSLDGKTRKLLIRCEFSAAYVAPGYLLFLRDGMLMAQQFASDQLALVGSAQPIAGPVSVDGLERAYFEASASLLIYRRGGFLGYTDLAWFDRGGRRLESIGSAADYRDVRLTPSGSHVATVSEDPVVMTPDIWVFDLKRGESARVTFGAGSDNAPVWSPDGRHLAFRSLRDDRAGIYRKAWKASGEEEVLVPTPDVDVFAYDWSRDGRFVLVSQSDPAGRMDRDLWALAVAGDQPPVQLVSRQLNQDFARFSPNGRWVAFQTNESGSSKIHVVPFPSAAGTWQVSPADGIQPIWSHTGRELFYLSGDGAVMAVEVRDRGASIEFGTARQLFTADVAVTTNGWSYDVAPDASRFLVRVSADKPAPMTVVVNWLTEIER